MSQIQNQGKFKIKKKNKEQSLRKSRAAHAKLDRYAGLHPHKLLEIVKEKVEASETLKWLRTEVSSIKIGDKRGYSSGDEIEKQNINKYPVLSELFYEAYQICLEMKHGYDDHDALDFVTVFNHYELLKKVEDDKGNSHIKINQQSLEQLLKNETDKLIVLDFLTNLIRDDISILDKIKNMSDDEKQAIGSDIPTRKTVEKVHEGKGQSDRPIFIAKWKDSQWQVGTTIRTTQLRNFINTKKFRNAFYKVRNNPVEQEKYTEKELKNMDNEFADLDGFLDLLEKNTFGMLSMLQKLIHHQHDYLCQVFQLGKDAPKEFLRESNYTRWAAMENELEGWVRKRVPRTPYNEQPVNGTSYRGKEDDQCIFLVFGDVPPEMDEPGLPYEEFAWIKKEFSNGSKVTGPVYTARIAIYNPINRFCTKNLDNKIYTLANKLKVNEEELAQRKIPQKLSDQKITNELQSDIKAMTVSDPIGESAVLQFIANIKRRANFKKNPKPELLDMAREVEQQFTMVKKDITIEYFLETVDTDMKFFPPARKTIEKIRKANGWEKSEKIKQ